MDKKRCGPKPKKCCIGCIDQANDQFASQNISQVGINTADCGDTPADRKMGVKSKDVNVTVKDDEMWVNGKKIETEEE